MRPDERRHHHRVLLNQLCTLHFPGLLSPVKATIVDLSAGGMRLRIPRIQDRHLAHAFQVQCSIGAVPLIATVQRLYASSVHEISVRFPPLGARMHGEITKFVFARLRQERDLLQVQTGPAADEELAVLRPTIRRRGAGVEGYYQSRGGIWLERRKATHLRLD